MTVVNHDPRQNNEWEDKEMDYTSMNAKNCGLCIHQGICSAFAQFKVHVEPNLLDQNTTLKAENLAWICSLYVEKKDRK